MPEDLQPQTIAVMFKNLDEKIETGFKQVNDKVDATHAQAVKTNGRVTGLERWRAYIAGGVGVITLILIPILLIVLGTYIHK